MQPDSISRPRLKFGLALWLVSYLPLPLVLLALLHSFGKVQGSENSRQFLLIAWGIQYVIGLFGLLIAGKQSIALVRSRGWRNLPINVWHVLRTENTEPTPVEMVD